MHVAGAGCPQSKPTDDGASVVGDGEGAITTKINPAFTGDEAESEVGGGSGGEAEPTPAPAPPAPADADAAEEKRRKKKGKAARQKAKKQTAKAAEVSPEDDSADAAVSFLDDATGNDGGAMASAIAGIREQVAELEIEAAKYSTSPSPALLAMAVDQAADAVGATVCVINSLEQQLAEAEAKVGGYADEYKDPILKPLERDLATAKATLDSAEEVCKSTWKLPIGSPADQAAVADQAKFASLPMSVAEPGGTTMLRIVGTLALQKGASAVPSWMFAEFAKKRVETSTALVQMILKDVESYGAHAGGC